MRKPGQVSLDRALSKLGIASRTEARKWILAGLVRVNGVLRKSPGFSVTPERAQIEIEGEGGLQPTVLETRVFLLYKPRGVVTTHSDEKGRPTVFSLTKDLELHLIAVGRLDWATSGLLLLTNDTQFSSWLTDPRNQIVRTYVVTVRGLVTPSELEALTLAEGIEDRGEILRSESIVLRKASSRESHLIVRLTEGKNREIRRMFLKFGHEVMALKRVSYGSIELGALRPGEYREIKPNELHCAFPEAKYKQSPQKQRIAPQL
jgi:23S rRNA pseudouridine2605 synthase